MEPDRTTPPDPRRQRAEAALARVMMHDSAVRREAVQAQELIDDFVRKAAERGLEPVELRARLLSGGTVRTDRTGWYIKRNHSIAVGEDAGYYLLTVPGGWRARWRGVHLVATMPGLRVSGGGRDGETGDLADFLARTLAGGNR